MESASKENADSPVSKENAAQPPAATKIPAVASPPFHQLVRAKPYRRQQR